MCSAPVWLLWFLLALAESPEHGYEDDHEPYCQDTELLVPVCDSILFRFVLYFPSLFIHPNV